MRWNVAKMPSRFGKPPQLYKPSRPIDSLILQPFKFLNLSTSLCSCKSNFVSNKFSILFWYPYISRLPLAIGQIPWLLNVISTFHY